MWRDDRLEHYASDQYICPPGLPVVSAALSQTIRYLHDNDRTVQDMYQEA